MKLFFPLLSLLLYFISITPLRINNLRKVSPWKGEWQRQVPALQSRGTVDFSEAVREFSRREWYEMDGCSVLLPTFEQSAIPRAIVHFLEASWPEALPP